MEFEGRVSGGPIFQNVLRLPGNICEHACFRVRCLFRGFLAFPPIDTIRLSVFTSASDELSSKEFSPNLRSELLGKLSSIPVPDLFNSGRPPPRLCQ